MKASKLEIAVLVCSIGLAGLLGAFNKKITDFVYKAENKYIGKIYK